MAEARQQAIEALTKSGVDAYPHQIERTLRAADRALDGAPGADPTPMTAERWLRENTRELNSVRQGLNRHRTESRMIRASLALERHDLDRAYGWSVKLWRTSGGWNAMDRAQQAAERLEAEFPEARGYRDVPTAVDEVPILPMLEVVPQPGHPDGTRVEADRAGAATTLRGPGNRANEDAASTVTMPDGSRAVIVGDGLSRAKRSEHASFIVVTAARRELACGDRPGRPAPSDRRRLLGRD